MKIFSLIACLFAGLSVVLGAFGAHALKDRLTPEQLITFETGVRYQMYHALALFAVAWLSTKLNGSLVQAGGWCFTAGIVLFSGSLYLLACREVLGLTHWKWLGPVTPLGGLLFIMGWGCLLAAVARGKF